MLTWQPPNEWFSNSREAFFMQHLGVSNFEQLAELASNESGKFWQAVLDFGDIPLLEPAQEILDASAGPAWTKWCVGAKTNLAHICFDRWKDTEIWDKEYLIWDKEYLIWEGEDGTVQRHTYSAFAKRISCFAGGLASHGIGQGDVIAIYLPLIPEALVAYFAIVKLGAIALPLFSGYGAGAICERLKLADAKAIITCDTMSRRGKQTPMQEQVMQACVELEASILIVSLHRNEAKPLPAGESVHDFAEIEASSDEHTPTATMPADAPCVLHFTSGTTGKPKACVYTHIGQAAKMVLDHGILNGFDQNDRHCCLADMGWMVGTKLAVLPTVHGASLVIAEGAPDFPEPGRFWRLLDDHKVTFAELSPTLVRLMMAHGDSTIAGRDFDSLRGLITGGEAWTDAAWNWLFTKVCGSRVPIYDSAGGTEVSGSILLCDMLHPIQPGAFSIAVPGMEADVGLPDGSTAPCGEPGELIMRTSSIGLTQGLWQNHEGYLSSYWEKIPGVWVHGDLVSRDAEGRWHLHGRSDDTFKVAGRRIGPAEIENILMETGRFSEVAAILQSNSNEASLAVLCAALDTTEDQDTLTKLIYERIVTELDKPFRPSLVMIVDELPKTRNGKIMRRAAKYALTDEEFADTAALLNPEAVAAIRAYATLLRKTT